MTAIEDMDDVMLFDFVKEYGQEDVLDLIDFKKAKAMLQHETNEAESLSWFYYSWDFSTFGLIQKWSKKSRLQVIRAEHLQSVEFQR